MTKLKKSKKRKQRNRSIKQKFQKQIEIQSTSSEIEIEKPLLFLLQCDDKDIDPNINEVIKIAQDADDIENSDNVQTEIKEILFTSENIQIKEEQTISNENAQKLFNKKFTNTYNQVGLFQNIGNTCYINTALQTMRQMSQISVEIFKSSKYGEMLLELFTSNSHSRKHTLLQEVFQISQETQDHQALGGDAYLCLISLINKLFQSTESQEQKERLEKCFQHQYKDGLWCSSCQKWDESQYPPFIDTFIGKESTSFQKALTESPSFFEDFCTDQICQQCQINKLIAKRNVVSIPQFVIIKVPNSKQLLEIPFKSKPHVKQKKRLKNSKCHISNLSSETGMENEFNPLTEKITFEEQDFKVIGFSNWSLIHYTYTAKIDDQRWINYNDEYSSIVNTNSINRNNINFYLLSQLSE